MKKNQSNLVTINAVFIMSLIVANIVAGKVVDLFGFIVPAAVVAYGITFLCTDVINELWGKEEAQRTVILGIKTQAASLILILLAIALPSAEFATEYNESFKIVLSQNVRIVFASFAAYIVAQTNDVIIFNYIRNKTKGKKKWLRNNLSTMASQLIDTSIFITIAFYGIVPNLIWMVISQYVVKFLIAVADTPFFYLLTRGSENKQNKIEINE